MARWSPTDKYGIGGDDFRATTRPPSRPRTPAEARAAYGAAEAAAYAQDVGNEAGETAGRERDDRFDALGNDLDDPLDPSPDDLAAAPAWYDPTAAEFEGHEDYDDECWATPCDFDSSSPRDLF